MPRHSIPSFCVPCIERLRAQCKHTHISINGGWHFSGGDVWDDITEVCDDCGANLDQQPPNADPFPDDESISFEEEPLCEI